ncbi:helix-turn-helix domain-containing protein [Amycolatopsis regifaucium]|uniref:Transcriptional regulator n=1 Tax=Amycolatopsis regifaucium TaxID=546365 RepID=A0A154MDK0_9PSEU|nr:helix-turn-helix transcriptional regulator [Amycolatopsis regifaucium]KZB82615.1 XRE family transcriptional regulator [Amycolatopsis regifaucium]OKA10325.1 transcriptional regulator [Amycolatopsis regifaucium]
MSEEVGGRLRRLRAERGLTQRELAEPHYTAAYVSSVETGARTPSGDALRHFATQLGVDTGELLGVTSPRDDVRLDLDIAMAAADFLAGKCPALKMRRLARRAERIGRARQAGLAWLWLARYSESDDRPRLIAAAEAALTEDVPPYRELAMALRANVLIGWGEPHHGMHLLRTALDASLDGYPHPLLLLTLRGYLAEGHLRLGETAQAAQHASEALRLARGDEEILAELTENQRRLAEAYLDGGRVADAATAVSVLHDLLHERALRPVLARCLFARALVRRADDLEGALADLRASKAAAPDHAVTLELADLCRELGRLDDAATLLTEAAEAIPADSPYSASLMFQRGSLALARGDLEAAEAGFAHATDVAALHDARGVLAASVDKAGGLLLDQGRVEEAADLLRRGLLLLGAEEDSPGR